MRYTNTANRLREAMYKAGISAKELSDKSGVSQASISQYMNATHCPSNINAGRMGEVLGVSPAWLMGFDVDNVKEQKPGNPFRTYSEEEEIFLEALRDATQKAKYEAYAILKAGKK